MEQGKKRGGTRGAAAAAAAAAAPPALSGPSAKRGRWPSEKDRTVLGVAFGREGTAPQLSLSRDALEVAGDGKGYRMARANTGVREGHWYGCLKQASFGLLCIPDLSYSLLQSTTDTGRGLATCITALITYVQLHYAVRTGTSSSR